MAGLSTAGPRRWLAGAIGLLFGLNLLLAADDERQTRWPVEPDTTTARWLRRGHTFLAAEPVWSMYAPEPWRFTGWWVAVGRRQDGTLVDPITGQAPTLTPPLPGESLLRWVYLWNPPSTSLLSSAAASDPPLAAGQPEAVKTTDVGTEDAYLRFLLRRTADRPLRWLALVYVYETMDDASRSSQVPLLSRLWPADLPPSTVARALQAELYRVEADSLGVAGWRPQPLVSAAE